MTVLGRMTATKAGMFAVVTSTLFVLVGLTGHLAAPYDPLQQDLVNTLRPPSSAHLFGTDQLGRDVLSRVITGTRVSLFVSAVVIAIGGVLGALLGFGSGFLGGVVDEVIMRVIDALMAFPGILLALVAVTVLGPGLKTAAVAVGITEIPVIARLTRSSTLSVKEELYVEAARAVGAREFRIVTRHVVPNCLSPLIVQLALIAADAILIGAGLSFLGLGAQPPTPEWGIMLSDSRVYLWQAPYLAIFPGTAILIAAMSFNLLGDCFRRAFDVRMQL